MAVVIRLSRGGTKKKPYYSIVAADKSAPRDGKHLEKIGTYNPKIEESKRLVLDQALLDKWVKNGAKMTETVGHLVKNTTK